MADQSSHGPNDHSDVESAFVTLASDTRPSNATDNAIRVLVAESRQDLFVRRRLGSLEMLDHLVAVIVNGVSEPSAEMAVRCIGNACADNDEGRENITKIGLNWVNECLNSDSVSEHVKMTLTKALYNICMDYEPAQQACYRDKIHYQLIRFCGSAYAEESEESSLLIDLIFYICGHKPSIDAVLEEGLPHDVLTRLMDLPMMYAENSETDTYASLIESILVFLRDPKIQAQIIQARKLECCWEILQILDAGIASLNTTREEDAEDLNTLTPLSASLNWCLSDIAALPDFAKIYTLESALTKQLIGVIERDGIDGPINNETPSHILLTAACQVVGNLLWALPPETYGHLVEVERLHQPCLRVLAHSVPSTTSSELFHALTGLLVQLTRPSTTIRELIGADACCRPALMNSSEHDLPLIRQDAVRLIKVLGKDCVVNQEQFGELAKSILVSLKDVDEQQPRD